MFIYIVTTFLCLRCSGKASVDPLVKQNHTNLENIRISPINKKYKLVISPKYFLDIISMIIRVQSDCGLKFAKFWWNVDLLGLF